MPDFQDPTPPPSRIILPGGDPEPSGERPRIILPPGATVESREDLPEYPRLRAVQMQIVRDPQDPQRELLLVMDPLGVCPQQMVLGLETIALLELLDGTTSLTDLQALVMRESKDLRLGNIVREFVGKLDDQFLLEGPRFEAEYDRLQAEWHPLEVRPAALDGVCYPNEHEALEGFLDEQFTHARAGMTERGESEAQGETLPRALLIPHLDPRRRGHVQARAALEVGPEVPLPLRVVVFGTGHQLHRHRVALTRKRFETPFGQVPCDTEFVDRVAARVGPTAYREELVHRDEHSIEFVLLYLQRRLRYRRFTLVPILCGGFEWFFDESRDPRGDETLEALVAGVREAEAELGGPTLYVASVDFSHVGPRFGDPALDEEGARAIQQVDETALNAAASGDADRWWASLAPDENATRICGLGPTWCMLRCAEPGEGRPLLYDQSPEPGGLVSVAAMVWPGTPRA